jgi:TetR/AcrR family transcriptional regulator, transcriptional repressor for nem operon
MARFAELKKVSFDNIPTDWYVLEMVSRSSLAPPTDGQSLGVKARLIEAAMSIVRQKGYAATSIDDLCKAAGVTKGAFFHHFASKEALAVAGAEQWTARAEQLIFTAPPWTRIEDPLERLLAHIDFRLSMLDGPVEAFTCFVGTMVQETFASNDAIRAACDLSISTYAQRLAEDIQPAIDRYGIRDGVTALDLAYHIQAVLQGAFIMAKAKGDPAIARDSVTHLMRYVKLLFDREN